MLSLTVLALLVLLPLAVVIGDTRPIARPWMDNAGGRVETVPPKSSGELLAGSRLSQLYRHDALDGLVIDARPAVHAERGAVGSVRVVDAETGAAWLYLRSERLNDFFGYATTWLGDINGDGWPDLAIGIPNAADPLRLERRGIVRIVSGLDGSTLREIEGAPGEVFGVNLAAIEHAQHEVPLLAVQWRRQNADGGVERGGDLYDVSSGERVDGVIDSQTLATGRTGIAWRYHDDRLHGGIAGDLNGDGLVDLADFQILIDALGTEIEVGADAAMADDPMLALGLIGDLNRDGVVDAADLQLFAGVLEGMVPGAEDGDGEFNARSSPQLPPGGCTVFPCGDLEPFPDDPVDGDFPALPPPGGGSGGGTGNEGPGVINPCLYDDNGNGILNCEDCDSVHYMGDERCCDGAQHGLIDVRISNAVRSASGRDCEEDDGLPAVLFANTLDGEWDGIPDYLDGYAGEGGIGIDEDCPRCRFAVLNITVCDPWQTFTLNYGGGLRVWKVTYGSTRSIESIHDGGDLIPPGEYTIGELGGVGGAVGLWLESLTPSEQAGDRYVSVTAEKPSETICRIVRATSIGLEIEGRHWPYGGWERVYGFYTNSAYPHDFDETAERKIVPGARYVHRLRVLDAREERAEEIRIGTVMLPLQTTGRDYAFETPEFVVTEPGESLLGVLPSVTLIEVASDEVAFEFNPGGRIKVSPRLKRTPKYMEELAKFLWTTADDMKASNWTPAGFGPGSNPQQFSGHFGQEVHRRMALHFNAKPGWVAEVWVHKDTKAVVSIGNSPGGNLSQFRSFDLGRLKAGQSIGVGDIFNPDKFDDFFEVKTSINGGISQEQRQRYKDLLGPNRRAWVATPTTRWSPYQGWVLDRRFEVKFRGFQGFRVGRTVGAGVTAFGAAVSVLCVYNILHSERFDDELAMVTTQMVNIFTGIQNQIYCGHTGRSRYQNEFADFIHSLCRYMDHFAASPVATGVIRKIFIERVFLFGPGNAVIGNCP